jgi:hypothetical protein
VTQSRFGKKECFSSPDMRQLDDPLYAELTDNMITIWDVEQIHGVGLYFSMIRVINQRRIGHTNALT